MNLKMDLYQVTEHAQTVMKSLGITYQYAIPQSIADRWDFWNCKNVPSPLPAFLSEITGTPHSYIGYGLSKEMADAIVADAGAEPPA